MDPDLTMPPRFKAELRAILLSHPSATSAAGSVIARPRRLRRRMIPVLVLAVAALAAFLVIVPGGGGGLAPLRASAATVLNASAAVLEKSASSLSLPRGRYFYLREAIWFRYAFPGTRPFVVRSIDEAWVARDGSGRERVRVLEVSGRPSPGFGSDTHSHSVIVRARARPFSLATADPHLRLSYSQLRALPADPRRLTKRINQLAGQELANYTPGSRTLSRGQLETVLRFGVLRGVAEAPTPPAVRAAVYRALALTPGIRLLGHRSDASGRTGMAVAANLGAEEIMLIIDPSTGQLLQTSRMLLHRSLYMQGWPPGLVNRATILASGVVGSTQTTIR